MEAKTQIHLIAKSSNKYIKIFCWKFNENKFVSIFEKSNELKYFTIGRYCITFYFKYQSILQQKSLTQCVFLSFFVLNINNTNTILAVLAQLCYIDSKQLKSHYAFPHYALLSLVMPYSPSVSLFFCFREDLNKIPYTTMCIKESLRLCPPVPGISRKLTKPLTFFDGRTVPEGNSLIIQWLSNSKTDSLNKAFLAVCKYCDFEWIMADISVCSSHNCYQKTKEDKCTSHILLLWHFIVLFWPSDAWQSLGHLLVSLQENIWFDFIGVFNYVFRSKNKVWYNVLLVLQNNFAATEVGYVI